jgi:hypothetical protein
MTVAAGLPGADAFAAFYARFADAIRAVDCVPRRRPWPLTY